jgi:hypothetical protein
VNNQFTNDTLDQATQISNEHVWTFRRASGLSTGKNTAQNNLIRKSVSTPAVTTVPPFLLANPSGTNGIPKALLSASAVQSPSLQQDQMLSEVSVSFTRDGSDVNFGSARVWFTGYQGSSTPVLMASGTTSPITFLCQSTKETVVVSVQPVSPSGLTADLSFAISGTVTLNGVVNSPAPPSIAQSLVATPTGYQFSFNFLTGLLTDVIANYRVYRNTSNTTAGATVIQTVAQDTNGSSSTYVVQDNVGSQNTGNFFYWVSAVNTSGLESSLTAAQSGTVAQGGWVIPPQYGTTIIIDNANFEASTVLTAGAPPGWITNFATLSYDTATPYAGAQSLKAVASVPGGGIVSAKRWSCKPGDQFYVSIAQKSDGTSNPQSFIVFLNSAGTGIGFVTATHGTGTSWTIDTATGTAPAGAVAMYFTCTNSVTGGVAYFDQVLVDRMVDPTTTVVAKGSTPSSLSSGFTYTSTTTSVTISWSGLTIYRADGSTTAVTNGSITVTGLSASTTYRVYPYWDEALAALNFVNPGSGGPTGVGSPAMCYTAGSNPLSQNQNLQSRVPLTATAGFNVATTASGSGGGSGGGSGNCLHEDMLVETNRAIIKVIDVEVGDQILGGIGFESVTRKKVATAEMFIRVQLMDGSELIVTPSHPFTMPEGSERPMKRAQDLSLSDFLITTTGVGAIKSIEVVETKARKVSLTVEPSHTFFAGKNSPTILAHNALPS